MTEILLSIVLYLVLSNTRQGLPRTLLYKNYLNLIHICKNYYNSVTYSSNSTIIMGILTTYFVLLEDIFKKNNFNALH